MDYLSSRDPLLSFASLSLPFSAPSAPSAFKRNGR